MVVIGSNKDPFVSRAVSLQDYCAMYPGLGICDLLDPETSMGPSPGPYDEPQPCGNGSTDGSCHCRSAGEEKVYHEGRNQFLCMDEEQVLTHRIDGCMRGAAADRLGTIVPHELRFASFAQSGKWGEAGRLAGDFTMQVIRAGVVGAGALAVLAWWLWGGNDRVSVPIHRADDTLSATSVSPGAPQDPTPGPEMRAAPEGEARRPDLADVRAVCGDSPWRPDVPQGCMDALDRRYLDEPAIYVRYVGEPRPWSPVPTRDRVTWRDALRDPVALRQTVEEALNDPECRAVANAVGHSDEETADPYRHDLRERCAADDIARLSAFHYACLEPRHAPGDWNYDGSESWRVAWEELDKADTDFDEYQRQRQALEDAWFQLGWRVQRCRTVPDGAFAKLGVGDRRENNPTWLQILAANLGSEWANVRDYSAAGPGSPMCTDDPDPNLDALAEWHLPLAHAALARCYERDDVRRAAHLLAAKRHDREERLDWTGWKDAFTDAQLADAEAEAGRIYERGWIAPYMP